MAGKVEDDWHWFDYDELTFKTTYIKFVGDKVHMQTRIPMWLARQILEENKAKAKQFDEMGKWKGAKHGAVIANVPDHIDQHFKRLSGYNPTVSGWYDRDKYNSFLDDSDYAYLRTGGGKIGKKKAAVIQSPKTIAKITGVA